jgi:hypothetical protein
MFRLAFEDRYRVFLARFTGIYVSEDVTDLQRVLTSFVAEHGPVHGLFDYTEVEAVAVPQSRSPITRAYRRSRGDTNACSLCRFARCMTWHAPMPFSSGS